MLREIVEGSKKVDMKWLGGPDAYKDMKEIEDLILNYDFHYGRIDDGPTYDKAKKKNQAIAKKLNDMGVTAFSNADMGYNSDAFKKANKKDIKVIK